MSDNKYFMNDKSIGQTELKLKMEAVQTALEIDIVENVNIQTTSTQVSYSSLMIGLENGDYLIPGFQRMYRWSEEQAEGLAVSLVRGMPIPPIYCYRNYEQQKVILDGQQRLMSLYFYYIGKFLKRINNAFIDVREKTKVRYGIQKYLEQCELKEKQFNMRYREENGIERVIDITYHNLSERLRRRIDFCPIMLIEVNVDSENYRELTMHKIFANLNIGGTPLSSQELRNGIYGCGFYDMLYDVNITSQKWRRIYSGNVKSPVNKESKDVELLLSMCAYKFYVTFNGTSFSLPTGYKGKKTTLLDDFSEEVKHFRENEIDIYKQDLLCFIEHVEEIFGNNKSLLLEGLFIAWLYLDKRPIITKKVCENIINDEKYSSTVKSGTSGKKEIEKRLGCVYDHLSGADKCFT